MDCPRCGTQLTEISIEDDGRAVYCEECSFADIESKHTPTPESEETWEDAFRRFYGENREEPIKEPGQAQSQSTEN
ncbi:MAG: hypothetical protein U5K70_01810 [Halodesulfurarchaeum sp.]|nr:hypothetical protein [Halodesulfurarchaeum sp.]